MYRHLLVPIDDTSLSATNVDVACELARTFGARISFFHATADLGATGDGAVMRSVLPGNFNEAALGETNALLTKAIAGTVARGVECKGIAHTSDHAAEAIIEAALENGCDLIVMASRGARSGIRGWLYNSQTERVLRGSPIALLVTRVASMHPLSAEEQALGIIRDEHRSLAVVIQGMENIVSEASAAGQAPDYALLEPMVAYLRAFPERVHHPKEEKYLHRWMRERAPECEAMLASMEVQHVGEHELVEQLASQLALARQGDAAAAGALSGKVMALVTLVRTHIGFEERNVLPLASSSLHEEEWKEIAAAFTENHDPKLGDLSSEEFLHLFTTIANTMTAGSRRDVGTS